MMKFLALGLLSLPALASAQTAPAPTMPPSLPDRSPAASAGADQRPNTPLDAAAFCYFEGNAYSKGAEHAGQTCTTGMVSYNATPGRPASSLMWMPSHKR